MTLLDYVKTEDSTAEIKEILEEEEEELGRRSLYNEMLANNPEMLKARLEYFEKVMYGGSLDREIRRARLHCGFGREHV